MSKIKLDDLSKEMDKLITQFMKENFDATQRALTTTAKQGADILSKQSPIRTGRFKSSWDVETKYANTKYIYNSALANNRIPLSNIVEYTPNNTPFIVQTMDRYKGELFRRFISEYEKEIKKEK